MASDRRGGRGRDPVEEEGEDGSLGLLPDILRRMMGLGFSGFFMTETALRKALGDTLPKEWIEFAVEQSDRTRDEFIERLAGEIARTMEAIDLVSMAERVLEGHTLEVKAEIRLRPDKRKKSSAESAPRKVRFTLAGGGKGG